MAVVDELGELERTISAYMRARHARDKHGMAYMRKETRAIAGRLRAAGVSKDAIREAAQKGTGVGSPAERLARAAGAQHRALHVGDKRAAKSHAKAAQKASRSMKAHGATSEQVKAAAQTEMVRTGVNGGRFIITKGGGKKYLKRK